MKAADNRLLFIAGPCVIESEGLVNEIAAALKEMVAEFDVDFIFKASFDKANRTSVDSFRGPGLDAGLQILAQVKGQFGLPVLSDVHDVGQVAPAAEVLDVLQIPAFLCRQTDLLVAAGKTGKTVNVKKGQFVAPQDMQYAVNKVRSAGPAEVWLTERGASFGYHNLVVDYRSLSIMRELGCPVIFDATHAVQIPSAGGVSSGDRQYVTPLTRAAAAYGIDGLFIEVHPDPPSAKSDGANSLYLRDVPVLLEQITKIRQALLA